MDCILIQFGSILFIMVQIIYGTATSNEILIVFGLIILQTCVADQNQPVAIGI